jgi:hypothetical protein
MIILHVFILYSREYTKAVSENKLWVSFYRGFILLYIKNWFINLFILFNKPICWVEKYLSTGVNILCSAQRFRKTRVRFLWPFTTWVLQPKKAIRVYSSERQNRQTVTTTKPWLCVDILFYGSFHGSFSISIYCLVQTCRHPWAFGKHNKGQQTVFLLLFLPIATRDSIL